MYTIIGTHDIQNVVVNSSLSHPDLIRVTGNLVEGSNATGIFLIIYSLTDKANVQYVATKTEQNNISINVNVLTGTKFGVSVFALEDGLPFPRVVTAPRNITMATNSDIGLLVIMSEYTLLFNSIITETAQQSAPPIQYKLQPAGNRTCINCTFLDNTLTDCVAVVHQQISFDGLVNIKSSHKFTRSGDTAYGCIEGVNLEEYQVGLINGKRIMPITKPTGTLYLLNCVDIKFIRGCNFIAVSDKEIPLAGAIVGAGTCKINTFI